MSNLDVMRAIAAHELAGLVVPEGLDSSQFTLQQDKIEVSIDTGTRAMMKMEIPFESVSDLLDMVSDALIGETDSPSKPAAKPKAQASKPTTTTKSKTQAKSKPEPKPEPENAPAPKPAHEPEPENASIPVAQPAPAPQPSGAVDFTHAQTFTVASEFPEGDDF